MVVVVVVVFFAVFRTRLVLIFLNVDIYLWDLEFEVNAYTYFGWVSSFFLCGLARMVIKRDN